MRCSHPLIRRVFISAGSSSRLGVGHRCAECNVPVSIDELPRLPQLLTGCSIALALVATAAAIAVVLLTSFGH
jgi:hypothetical protein